jgi:hypothetical protein
VTRPDLSSDDGVRAYRAELRGVGRSWRLAGFGLIVLAVAILWGAPQLGVEPRLAQTLGYGALAGGWALMIYAIFLRTRHHRRRLREIS